MATIYDKMDLSWDKALEEKREPEYAEKYLYTMSGQTSCIIAVKNEVPVLAAFNYLVPKCLVGLKCRNIEKCKKNNGIDYCDKYNHDVDYGGSYETNMEREALVVWKLDDTARNNLAGEGFSALDKIPKSSVHVFRLPYECIEPGNEKMLINNVRRIMKTGFGGEFDRLFWVPCSSAVF